jgi:hypothetical protein
MELLDSFARNQGKLISDGQGPAFKRQIGADQSVIFLFDSVILAARVFVSHRNLLNEHLIF